MFLHLKYIFFVLFHCIIKCWKINHIKGRTTALQDGSWSPSYVNRTANSSYSSFQSLECWSDLCHYCRKTLGLVLTYFKNETFKELGIYKCMKKIFLILKSSFAWMLLKSVQITYCTAANFNLIKKMTSHIFIKDRTLIRAVFSGI